MDKCLEYLKSLGVDIDNLADCIDVTSLTDYKSMLMELVVTTIKSNNEELLLPAVVRNMLSVGTLPVEVTHLHVSKE